MKIIVDKKGIKITTSIIKGHYPYQYREAIQMMLEADGVSKDTILEIFNMYPVETKCAPSKEELILSKEDL